MSGQQPAAAARRATGGFGPLRALGAQPRPPQIVPNMLVAGRHCSATSSARALWIYDGTSEVHRMVVARSLLKNGMFPM